MNKKDIEQIGALYDEIRANPDNQIERDYSCDQEDTWRQLQGNLDKIQKEQKDGE